MAQVRENIILQGLSGKLGDQLVLKRDKAGRTIVSIKPYVDPHREATPAQQAQQARFQDAAAYAKDAAAAQPIYEELAKGTPKTAYNVAMADWFHSPEVRELDLSGYTGQPGEKIRARVMDDVQVARVNILIATGADVVVEQGVMTYEQGSWYTYTTTADCPAGPVKVVVTGLDLPGHSGHGEGTLTAK